jgi:predicted transcriptional regulator
MYCIQISEKDLAVVIIDALSYHDGWVTEDRFAKKLNQGGKQVRKMMQFLGKQGFVVREHRRERKQGTKVESVAEQETMAAEARQATYVCIDYPHFYDMLRLRLYLAKKTASERIDGGGEVRINALCEA